MLPSTEALYDKALSLAANVEDNFSDLERTLRQMLDKEPELFHKIIEKFDLGRRKAYYLVEASRTFDPLPISHARLRKLSWTKLQIIARHVTKDNVEDLVSLAEQSNAKERLIRGEKPVKNARCVLTYFKPKQYAEFEAALVKYAARDVASKKRKRPSSTPSARRRRAWRRSNRPRGGRRIRRTRPTSSYVRGQEVGRG